jgi:hypothetical protein
VLGHLRLDISPGAFLLTAETHERLGTACHACGVTTFGTAPPWSLHYPRRTLQTSIKVAVLWFELSILFQLIDRNTRILALQLVVQGRC